jgi:quercetin dioxygenase-like cupin family protein
MTTSRAALPATGLEVMKIHVRPRQASADKMAKIASPPPTGASLTSTVAAGQSQKAHTHDDQDKIYYVIEGSGRFALGGREERLAAGEALVAPAGIEHGLVNDGAEPLLVLVVVTPPPPHGAGPRQG